MPSERKSLYHQTLRGTRTLSPATPSSSVRLPGVEGTRAIAAGSILVFHVWRIGAPGGTAYDLGWIGSFFPDLQFGVVLFFVLSGFLLYWPFAAGIVHGDGFPSVAGYLRNRALRILPAYWAILLCSALLLEAVVHASRTSESPRDPLRLATATLFVQNYDPDSVVSGIGPAWSLNVEVVFYLVLPVLALAACRLATALPRVAAALLPAGFLLCTGLAGKAIAAWVVPPLFPFDGWEQD